MRHILSFTGLAALLLLLVQCDSNSIDAKKKKLQSLKSDVQKMQDEISALEEELALADTSTLVAEQGKLISVQTVIAQPFDHYLEAQGIVDAQENAFVQPQMPGLITALYVQEGDRVTKGQILAQTDASVYEKGLEEIRSGLAFATTAYEKQKRLWDQNIGSEIQYLAAKNQKEMLESRLKTTQEQLDMTKIKAPFNGTVDEIKVKVGEFASPGYFGIRVVNTNKLKVSAKLADSYIGKVKRGDQVILDFPDINKSTKSIISFVGEAVNAQSRTFGIEAQLGYDALYKPNMLAKIKILDQHIDSAIVVPSNTIQTSIDGEFVLVAVEDKGSKKAVKKAITAGPSYNGFTVITSGLDKGDKLITFGFSELSDGQLIDFTESAESSK